MCAEKITDSHYFRRLFERLTNEFADWLEDAPVAALDDFDDELPVDLMYHWYLDEMTAPEIGYFNEFFRRWELLAERARREQVCADCGEYTLECFWKLYAGRMLCRKCEKIAESLAASKIRRADVQPNLF